MVQLGEWAATGIFFHLLINILLIINHYACGTEISNYFELYAQVCCFCYARYCTRPPKARNEPRAYGLSFSLDEI